MTSDFSRPQGQISLNIDDDDAAEPTSPQRPSPVRADSDTRQGFLHEEPRTFQRNFRDRASTMHQRYAARFKEMSLARKVLAVIALLCGIALAITTLVLYGRLFDWMVKAAKRWRETRGGWVLLWIMTFLTAFPPVIGYGMCVTIAGIVYGMKAGWLIAATANVAGSAVAFVVYRRLFLDYMTRRAANNKRWAAFAIVLKHDGLKLLCMIRLCPLPYSFSNGAIATVPTVSWSNFTLATALVTPKLLTHIFIGSRLALLADHNSEMDAKSKFVSYLSIFFTVAVGVTTGWIVYRRTKARAAQLEAMEWENAANAERSASPLPADYSDGYTDEEAVKSPDQHQNYTDEWR